MKSLCSLKSIVKQNNLTPKKSLGQNFLLDQNITDKIVKASCMKSGDHILEIGPGPGCLTRSILALNPQKLVVIEQDLRFIQILNELRLIYPQLLVINDDARKINEKILVPAKTRIIANLPYNIGTVLLFKWLEDICYWSSLTLMLQKEVVERMLAKPFTKDYGKISVILQILCDLEWNFDLKPDVFFPPPKVTSSVITLKPQNSIPKKEIIQAVQYICKILFGQRRKMLRSTLKQVHPDTESLIFNSNIDLTQRPEELSVTEFLQIAQNYLDLHHSLLQGPPGT